MNNFVWVKYNENTYTPCAICGEIIQIASASASLLDIIENVETFACPIINSNIENNENNEDDEKKYCYVMLYEFAERIKQLSNIKLIIRDKNINCVKKNNDNIKQINKELKFHPTS